jgi:hypothetical protein
MLVARAGPSFRCATSPIVGEIYHDGHGAAPVSLAIVCDADESREFCEAMKLDLVQTSHRQSIALGC